MADTKTAKRLSFWRWMVRAKVVAQFLAAASVFAGAAYSLFRGG